MKLLTRTEILSIILKFIFALFQMLLALIIPFIFQFIIDNQSLGNINFIISFILVYLLSFIINAVFNILITKQKYQLIASFQNKTFNTLMHLKIREVNDLKAGEVSEMLSNDVRNAGEYYFETFPDLLITGLNSLASVIVVLFLDFKLTFIILGLIVLMCLILVPLFIYTAKFSQIEYEESAKLTSFLSEVTKRIPLIKANTNEQLEIKQANQIFTKLHNNTRKSLLVNTLLSPIIGGVILFTLGSIIVIVAFRVSSGLMSGGILTAYTLYIIKVISATLSFVFRVKNINEQQASLKRLKALNNTSVEQLTTGETLSNVNSLEFKEVSFKYSDKLILDKLNFSLVKGESIAIVGASGSGKSTMLALLEGFYQPNSGEILINEHNYNQYSLNSIRAQISYVAQDYLVMGQTIKENISYGLDISDEQLINSLKASSCFDFIFEIPNDLNYELSNNQHNLSGGQIQRLAIARAYLKNSDIWLLDEVTANLDAISEKAIVDLISKIKKDKLIITIAHRLSTVVNSDRIIVLEDGKISGIGSHEELLRSHDYYKELVKNQFISNNHS